MTIVAIDPGPVETAVVEWDGFRPTFMEILSNEKTRDWLENQKGPSLIAVEMIASYGMAVGSSTFETCVWIGRFIEVARVDVELIFRKDIKLFLCGTMRAKDANIRQALLDKIGPQGTKKTPGPTYGIKSHTWAALAVAVYAANNNKGK